MKLNHRQYLVINEMAETVIGYDDANRLISWLLGKRTGHLKIIVVGTNGRAQVLEIGNDIIDFQKLLISTMNSLAH